MTSTTSKTSRTSGTDAKGGGSLPVRLALAWAVVGIPLAYGVTKTVQKAAPRFS